MHRVIDARRPAGSPGHRESSLEAPLRERTAQSHRELTLPLPALNQNLDLCWQPQSQCHRHCPSRQSVGPD